MSTTFGIKIKSIDEPVKIAQRHGIGNGEVQITIFNPLVYALKKKKKVIALDNGQQGVETINDLLSYKNIVNSFS